MNHVFNAVVSICLFNPLKVKRSHTLILPIQNTKDNRVTIWSFVDITVLNRTDIKLKFLTFLEIWEKLQTQLEQVKAQNIH